MSLEWHFDHDSRLVLVRGSGTVTYDDLGPLLRAIGDADAGSYGKLIDLSKSQIGMDPDRLLMAAAQLRAAHALRTIVGPLALITAGDVPSPVLGALAAADRYIRVFVSPGQARRWLRRMEPSLRNSSGDR